MNSSKNEELDCSAGRLIQSLQPEWRYSLGALFLFSVVVIPTCCHSFTINDYHTTIRLIRTTKSNKISKLFERFWYNLLRLPEPVAIMSCQSSSIDSSNYKSAVGSVGLPFAEPECNSDLSPFKDIIDPSTFRKMNIPSRGTASTHAVYGALSKNGMIESYIVFQNLNFPEVDSDSWSLPQEQDQKSDFITVAAVVKLGRALDGHEGIVHGGILALLVDDVLGFGYEALQIPSAVTANLNINYLVPVEAGSLFMVTAVLTSREGRKLYWEAEVADVVDGQKRIFCEATSLYIIPRHSSNL